MDDIIKACEVQESIGCVQCGCTCDEAHDIARTLKAVLELGQEQATLPERPIETEWQRSHRATRRSVGAAICKAARAAWEGNDEKR